MRFHGGQLIKTYTEHRFRGNGLDSKGVGEDLISSIQIDIVKVGSPVREQADLGEQNVSITDGIASSGVKILRKSLFCVVFEQKSAEMISGGRVEFRVAASQFIVFHFLTCWVWF